MAAATRSVNGRQLLLLAALLFGIVTMHTLGHPTGHSSSPATGHSSHQMSGPATGHSSSHPSPSGSEQAASHARVAAATDAPVGMVGVDGVDGMDPLSVCLAVLAALTLVLLLKAGLLRPGGFAVPACPFARLLDGPRPEPPPPRILLSRLSVLRI